MDTKMEAIYTSCYCEENVYFLAHRYLENIGNLDDVYVVVISNDDKKIPVWHQGPAGKMVIWDYHVILVHANDTFDGPAKVNVYDLDTSLPFPSLFVVYVHESFRPELRMLQQFRQRFRVIPAQVFLDSFSSDRSHMLQSINGSLPIVYISPPPDYPPIQNCGGPAYLYLLLTETILFMLFKFSSISPFLFRYPS